MSSTDRVLLADIGGTNARFALADTSASVPLLAVPRRLYAAARHDQIDQCHVGREFAADGGGRFGAVRLADDAEIVAGVEEGAYALAHQDVVIGDDDADGLSHCYRAP